MGHRLNKFVVFALGGALLTFGGCSSFNEYAPVSEIQAGVPEASKAGYRIGAGDELEIKFFFTPELNDKMTVRPDGKISLMFAQKVQAEGLTVDELAANIRTLYAKHVKQLDFVVTVRAFASHKAYVAGEVTKPGPVALTGTETLLQVLANAGWANEDACEEIVVLRRPDATQQEKLYKIDITDITSGSDMSKNIIIKAGDIILVPPSGIVSADRWVDKNIRKLLPFNMNAGAAYNINPANNN